MDGDDREKFPEGFLEDSCLNCADYTGKQTFSIDTGARCNSEEIMKIMHTSKPMDAFRLSLTTALVGCRFFRKKHSLGTLANCVVKQLQKSEVGENGNL